MNWDKVITSIEQMPDELKNKSVWLYWRAKAFDSIGQTDKAHNLLEKIPCDYSYYSLLAQSELDNSPFFKNMPSKIPELSSQQLLSKINTVLNLYQLGKSYNSKSLINLVTN